MSDADPCGPWLDRWALTADGAAFSTRYGSHLAPVLAAGQPAMLKIAGGPEEEAGGHLMDWWAGEGAARVLAIEGQAILLERLTGGRALAHMARSGGDDEATRILCDVAGRLHEPRSAPPPATLVPLDRWHRSLGEAARTRGGPFAEAWAVARELLASPREVVVLHGDLHHDNVLDGGPRGWLAIDPKGLIGERGFEYANLFRNPDAEVALSPGRLARQARIVTEAAGLEPERLLAWVHAYAVLGAAWSLEDGHDSDAAVGLKIAEIARAELAR
ncbi:MAG TPA: aminoglycoside phosphotransferase family protein [Caulobacteraceae bacterium]|nr:aminoglycoside phosphotransferase family protein [Caulobacteraceae bacterium]